MSQVDLSALRMQPEALPAPRPPLGPRLLLAAIVLLALAVALSFLWPLLRPLREVRMAPVRTATTSAGVAATAIAEAAGWIEPDPFPTLVRPLVAGRIEAIPVLEGAAVEAGKTVVARIASAELLAARERAAAVATERERELEVATGESAIAEAELVQKAELRLATIEARIAVAEAEAKLEASRGNMKRAEADAAAARAAAQAQGQLAEAGGSYPVALERARAAAQAADATAAAAAKEVDAMARELTAARSRQQLADDLLAAPLTLQARAAAAVAARAKAEAALASARVELAIAERELAWTEVLAPTTGLVMKLLAAPGGLAGPEGEPILAIYDPTKLRARIDVPLGSVAGIHDGQQVELRSEVLGNALVRGVVQRVQRESDLLKNTLQVKVAVLDPPALLRPETLCRARFLGGTSGEAAANVQAFLVPKAALQDGKVFRYDPAARCARAVAVTVVQTQGDDLVVQGELSAAMRVILDTVQDGESVQEGRR